MSVSNDLAWVLAIVVLCALLFDLRRDATRLLTARNVVLGGILSWYVLEAVQLPPAVMQYGKEANRFALLLVALSTWAFLQGYREVRTRLFDTVGYRVSRLESRPKQWNVLRLAALIGFLPLLVYSGTDILDLVVGVLGMRKTWGGPLGRGTLGDFRAALLMLELFIWGISWLAIVFWMDRRNPPIARMFALLLVVWTLFRAYGSGTRSFFFAAILVPATAVFWSVSPLWRRRFVWATPVVALGFYLLASMMVVGRAEGSLSTVQRPEYVGHEMFRELLFIIQYVPHTTSYLFGETYWHELLSPIPRFVWPNKPFRFGVEYASWQGYDVLGGGPSLSPGIIGEMYANFGVIGVVMLSFLGGAICRAWDRLRERHANSFPVLMYYSAGLAVLFMSGRSATLAVVFPLLASYVCLVIVTGVRRGRRKLAPSTARASPIASSK